ncbi:MAG: phage tail protein [Treponema sp.]|nr:phage tail protein [Candidatus Treponema caballi]
MTELPQLFPATATAFTTRGFGTLHPKSCIVTEERNGGYELEMQIPVTDRRFADLQLRNIIRCKPSPHRAPQPFRIYRISKPSGGLVSVSAQHISYDLSGIPAAPFSATTAKNAMTKLQQAARVYLPFNFWTDKTTTATMRNEILQPLRALLGGQQGSVLDTYGGEYEFDNFEIKLWNARGTNRGVKIRYGKNLKTLEQEENCAAVYTGVQAYWYKEEDGYIAGTVQAAPGTYNFTRILPLDCTGDFENIPTAAQLNQKAAAYAAANNVGVPTVSLDVSFVSLEKSSIGIDGLPADLSRVELCDTVTVEFERLGIAQAAKVTRTVYDVLKDRYEAINVGDIRASLAGTIAKNITDIRTESTERRTAIIQTERLIKLEASEREGNVREINATLQVQAGKIELEATERKSDVNTINATLQVQATEIAAKVSQTGGTAQSFEWSHTASGIVYKANGQTVMTVDTSGLSIKGKVEATSGTIGGCQIVNGTLTIANANISSLNVDKLNGQIVSSQIEDEAVDTNKIAAAAVTTSKATGLTTACMSWGVGQGIAGGTSVYNMIENGGTISSGRFTSLIVGGTQFTGRTFSFIDGNKNVRSFTGLIAANE